MTGKMIFKDGGNIWFTSDQHFHHEAIMRFCSRPFKDVEEMDQVMTDRWNSVVGKNGIVFHLGDFCLGGSVEWTKALDRLNGKIYLCLGNHDLKNIRQGFMRRFVDVSMQFFVEIEKQKIYLNHNPFLCYGGSYTGVWQLFGHVHSGPFNTGLDKPRLSMLFPMQYDVGVDNNDFTPVSFYQVKEIIEKQVEESKK